jgi:hypothetical protein
MACASLGGDGGHPGLGRLGPVPGEIRAEGRDAGASARLSHLAHLAHLAEPHAGQRQGGHQLRGLAGQVGVRGGGGDLVLPQIDEAPGQLVKAGGRVVVFR